MLLLFIQCSFFGDHALEIIKSALGEKPTCTCNKMLTMFMFFCLPEYNRDVAKIYKKCFLNEGVFHF